MFYVANGNVNIELWLLTSALFEPSSDQSESIAAAG